MRATFLLLPLLLAACGSTPDAPEEQPEPYVPIEARERDQKSIGLFLTDISASIRAWTTKTLTASSHEERREQNLLELHLTQQVNQRRVELIQELENGPPQNRIVAAGALGFARRPEVLGSLIAALEDSEPRVVTNALMSIGVLQSVDTPLPPLCDTLQWSTNASHRWGAANALINVLQAGAVDETGCVVESAHSGLTDEEPMVRTQCALLLGQQVDSDSLESLGALLYDEYPLVASAAARAIGHIGSVDSHAKGRAARLLVEALENSDKPRQLIVLDDLVALSDRNYELQLERWREWALRLPLE